MPTRPQAKAACGPGQETKWYIHAMTFLVTQEVSLMAFVKFHNSLSSQGNAILAFRARKQWYLSLNESGPHSLWMWAILLTSGIHLFNHKMSVRKERFQWRKWYSRPDHVSWLGIWSKEIENDWKSGESYGWLYNGNGSKEGNIVPSPRPRSWHVIPHCKDAHANLLSSVLPSCLSKLHPNLLLPKKHLKFIFTYACVCVPAVLVWTVCKTIVWRGFCQVSWSYG